ncbi:MAG: hypothetical protein ACRD0K_08345 [Egibacteraceae bacterium]
MRAQGEIRPGEGFDLSSVISAEAGHRSLDKPLLADRALAHLAAPVGAGFDALHGLIDKAQLAVQALDE